MFKYLDSDARINGFTEGNSSQYSFYVLQHVATLVEMMGGSKGFVAKLDKLLTLKEKPDGPIPSDMSGIMGKYSHGNGPSHHIPHLYTLAGYPEKTQERLSQIIDRMYQNTPEGLSGNECSGQMSAWYILTVLGFYPVAPGSGSYVLGRPFVNNAVVSLENGKKLRVVAHDLNNHSKYVGKITINGKERTSPTLLYKTLMDGATIEFYMTNRRCQTSSSRIIPQNRREVQIPSSYLSTSTFAECLSTFFSVFSVRSSFTTTPRACNNFLRVLIVCKC